MNTDTADLRRAVLMSAARALTIVTHIVAEIAKHPDETANAPALRERAAQIDAAQMALLRTIAITHDHADELTATAYAARASLDLHRETTTTTNQERNNK